MVAERHFGFESCRAAGFNPGSFILTFSEEIHIVPRHPS